MTSKFWCWGRRYTMNRLMKYARRDALQFYYHAHPFVRVCCRPDTKYAICAPHLCQIWWDRMKCARDPCTFAGFYKKKSVGLCSRLWFDFDKATMATSGLHKTTQTTRVRSVFTTIINRTIVYNTRNSAIADKPRDAFKDINLRKIPSPSNQG